MDLSNKNIERSQCVCDQNYSLRINARQLGLIVAGFLVVNSVAFVAGFFWGKKSVVEAFSQRIEQDSFADQIYYSMCSYYDTYPEEDSGAEPRENAMGFSMVPLITLAPQPEVGVQKRVIMLLL